ncbi:peptide deformylase [Maribellus sediminis]|uniref:peptide deformylase n=1 Tax=Maribellus sediminis TaxID=2696285 RepID=UPI001430313C|nr:peptide deformylase [Maribellus sediminis]
MAIKDILLLGNPELYKVTAPVTKEELPGLLSKIVLMWESILDIRKTYGFGRAIAAPQIGLSKRIIALNVDAPLVMINPEITACSEEMIELWDDCMSFPNLLVKVRRHKEISVRFYDMNWVEQTWELENDMSELIQHEYDHLDGILATQRAIDAESFKWKA